MLFGGLGDPDLGGHFSHHPPNRFRALGILRFPGVLKVFFVFVFALALSRSRPEDEFATVYGGFAALRL